MNRKIEGAMHGNSRAQKVILGHRARNVRDNRVRKKKGPKRSEAQGHIGQEAHEARDM